MEHLYLITGSETYDKQAMLEKIKTSFGKLEKGINYIVLDKDTISVLENEINTYPFGYSQKLIVVKWEGKQAKENEEKEEKNDFLTSSLEETLKQLDDSVCVVFYGDFQSRSKLYQLVNQNGKCFTFEKKKENELQSWVTEYFKQNGVNMTNVDASYFLNLCGVDKQNLKNEMDKLIAFSQEKNKIGKEEIDKLCIRTSDVIIFDLTDSLGRKNAKKALESLNELLENKEPIQKIAIMIAKHFKALLIAKLCEKQGKNLMVELNSKSSYACNKYKEQAKYFDEKELVSKLEKLSLLDVDSKVGKIDLKIGLESFMMNET